MSNNQYRYNVTAMKSLPLSVALLAAVITFIIFIPALQCGFVNWDDPDFIARFIGMPIDFEFIRWCFTSAPHDLWIPLTWLSLAVDYSIWGQNPIGFHLTNIVFHALNTGLVVLCAYLIMSMQFTDLVNQQSSRVYLAAALLVGGLLFGIHPLRVESVAWISERKDVLNGFFAIGSVLCYLGHIASVRRSGGCHINYWYNATFVLFSLSLLAKPVTVILPLVYYTLDRHFLVQFRKELHRQLLQKKIPFLALSLTVALLTIISGWRNGILTDLHSLSTGDRIIISGNAVIEYIQLILYPSNLSPLFPLPNQITTGYYLKASSAALLTVVILKLHKKLPWGVTTWFCFLIPLLPVLALMQNGFQAYASRYTYLPSIAPGILVATGIITIGNRLGAEMRPRILQILTVTALFGLLFVYSRETQQYIAVWQNTGTLWSRVIKHSPVGRAYWYRGKYYLSEGDYQAAADDISDAIRIARDSGMKNLAFLYNARGRALTKIGRHKEAADDFAAAAKLEPTGAELDTEEK